MFDVINVASGAMLIAIGTVYQFARSVQILNETHINLVTVLTSSTLVCTIFIEMLLAKPFDAYFTSNSRNILQIIPSKCYDWLPGIFQREESTSYTPLSTLELHEFNLEDNDNTLEIDDTTEEWEVSNFGETRTFSSPQVTPSTSSANITNMGSRNNRSDDISSSKSMADGTASKSKPKHRST